MDGLSRKSHCGRRPDSTVVLLNVATRTGDYQSCSSHLHHLTDVVLRTSRVYSLYHFTKRLIPDNTHHDYGHSCILQVFVTARSELRKVLFLALRICDCFVCVWNISGTAEPISAKFTEKTCLVPRSNQFECQGQVKGQGHQVNNGIFVGFAQVVMKLCGF